MTTATRPGATVAGIRRLMAESEWPERTLKGRGSDQRIDQSGWDVYTFWTDRRFVVLRFSYWMGGVYDEERDSAALEILRCMARWVADRGYVVYVVPSDRPAYALVGRVGNEPRHWMNEFRDKDRLAAERLDPPE